MLGQKNTVTSAKDQKRRQANFENAEISAVKASLNVPKPHPTGAMDRLDAMRTHLRFTENSEITKKGIDGRADLRTHVRFAEDSTTSAVERRVPTINDHPAKPLDGHSALRTHLRFSAENTESVPSVQPMRISSGSETQDDPQIISKDYGTSQNIEAEQQSQSSDLSTDSRQSAVLVSAANNKPHATPNRSTSLAEVTPASDKITASNGAVTADPRDITINCAGRSSGESITTPEGNLSSNWDHDGAPTYDHEMRRPPRLVQTVHTASINLLSTKTQTCPIQHSSHLTGLANSEIEAHRAWEFLRLDFLCVVEAWQRPSDEVSLALPHVESRFSIANDLRRSFLQSMQRPLIKSWRYVYATTSYQILALSVRSDLNIVGVYLSPRASDVDMINFLDQLKSLVRDPTLLLGDWNARHDDWGRQTNKLGRRIRAWIRKWDLQLKAPSEQPPTFHTPNGSSVVDFFIAKQVLIRNVVTTNGSWDAVFDHNMVVADIE
ncbi:Endonuclease/exonuclease/phosphatase [Gracilaria domingensis]|nr:Endonuclease/exonuclease/phosphatase [Gracilaria domingensis]